MDNAWLRMDEPENLMQILGVLVFEGDLPLATARTIVAERLGTIPRFHQRIVLRDRRPYWEDDPGFTIERHLIAAQLPAPGHAGLADFASRLLSEPLPRDRPLWDMHLIAGYDGGTALLVRLHHAIGDGVALMMVLLSLTELDPVGATTNPLLKLFHDPEQSPDEARARGEAVMPDTMRLMLLPIESWARVPLLARVAGIALSFLRLVGRWPDPKTVLKGPLGRSKRAAWSGPFAVDEVRAVAKALGGTINDVLVSALTGGLHRYLVSRAPEAAPRPGAPEAPSSIPRNVRAAMPVSLRPLPEMAALGNRFGLIFLSLPVGIADPLERFVEVRRRAGLLKRSAEPWTVLGILRVMGGLALPLQRLVVRIFATKATAVLTNVPGPRETLYVAHAPIRDFFFWVPQSGHVGIGISIFSYAGQVRVGIATDTGLLPDPQCIVAGFEAAFAELVELAGSARDAAPSA